MLSLLHYSYYIINVISSLLYDLFHILSAILSPLYYPSYIISLVLSLYSYCLDKFLPLVDHRQQLAYRNLSQIPVKKMSFCAETDIANTDNIVSIMN